MSVRNELKAGWLARRSFGSGLEDPDRRKVARDITHGTLNLLMLYGCVTLFGFAFWVVAARWYDIKDVGHATVAYSVVGLASSLSLLGTNWWIIRYLPAESDKGGAVNEAVKVVSIATAIMVIPVSVFMVGYDLAKLGGEDLAILVVSTLALLIPSALYVSFVSALIGLGKSSLALVLNLIANGIRIPFVIVLSWLGPSGMIIALAASTYVGMAIGIVFLKTRIPGFEINLRSKLTRVKESLSYVTGNFANSTLNMMPGAVLPSLVAIYIGSEMAAAFYYCWLITTMLQAVSNATTTSFIARCAVPGTQIRSGVRRSARLLVTLLVPVSVGILGARNEIVQILGEEYAFVADAIPYFVFLGIVLSVNVFVEGLLRLRNDGRSLALMATVWAVGAIALAATTLGEGDLISISVALLISGVMASVVGIALLVFGTGNRAVSY